MPTLTPTPFARLRSNWEATLQRIRDAEQRSGRAAGSCRLLAVVKNRPDAWVRALFELGQSEVAENRLQGLLGRDPQLIKAGQWHLIGHLQSNKARRAREAFRAFHGLDSIRLAERLATVPGKPWPVFLQVNIGREPQKHGCDPAAVAEVVQAVQRHPRLQIQGLMALAPLADDPEAARPHFCRLRELAEELLRQGVLPPAAKGLSMGMSQDYETAVEEGATIVRVGSALYEGLTAPAALESEHNG